MSKGYNVPMPEGALPHIRAIFWDEVGDLAVVLSKEQEWSGNPFDLHIEAAALLSAMWCADLHMRKARDRNRWGMVGVFRYWWMLLRLSVLYTLNEVATSRDRAAEEAWQEHVRDELDG